MTTDLPSAAERAYHTVDARAEARAGRPTFTSFSDFARTVRPAVANDDAPPASAPADATEILLEPRDPAAIDALVLLASVLRDNDYGAEISPAGPVAQACFRLGFGESVDRDTVEGLLGAEGVAALVAAGWAELGDLDPSYVRLTMTVSAAGSVLTVSPRPAPHQDTVYLGPDSLALLRRAWPAAAGGRAADLGTGNGFLAAALATRCDHVVAADLSARCVQAASLVPVLNPQLAGRISVVCADVADGLAAGMFDLVTANPPWVPEPLRGARDPARRFAAGGPTGFELPRRFLDAAAALLAPRGQAFVSCLDLELTGGSRPLQDHVPALEAAGCAVELHLSPMPGADDMREWVRNRLGRVRSARLVIVELRSLAR